MRPIHLFELTSQQNEWLSTRQTLIAGNLANVNTPGYQAMDIEPFEAVLESTRLGMAATERGHMMPPSATANAGTEVEDEQSWEVYHSGANVSVEQELLKAGEVKRTYSLNVNIVKAFHRMMTRGAGTGG